MTTQLDPRIVRVTLELDGEVRTYDGLAVSARGAKSSGTTRNECDITIDNLSRDVRNAILTDTSPFTKTRKRRRVIVEAGRERDGVFRIFEGEVMSATVTQPPDIRLSIKAQTGAYHAGIAVTREGSAIEAVSSIAARVASDLGASLAFEATDKRVSNHSFTGAALRQIDAISALGFNAYLDDQVLVVKDVNQPRAGATRILNKDTGLVGIPEITERGVKCVCLLDRHLKTGGALRLESDLNPSVNGDYVIYQLDFDVATHAEPFYHYIEASRR